MKFAFVIKIEKMSLIVFLVILFFSNLSIVNAKQDEILFGSYYYDGWAGTNGSSANWAINAPEMLTYKLKYDYPEREPIWGWRDDDISIMERQIDLAADNGIDFFVFCWYWTGKDGHFDEKRNNSIPEHTSLNLFLKAKNRNRMKYSIIICNHEGAIIGGRTQWEETIGYLACRFFNDSQYLFVDDRPYISFFLAKDSAPYLKPMNKVVVNLGFKGLYSVACNYQDLSYDLISWYNNTFESGSQRFSKDYMELTMRTENAWRNALNKYNVAPTCIVGWDKRPWNREENFVFYEHRTSHKFYNHLKAAVDFVINRNDKNRIVHVYAWNELGEGGYLVPTKGDKKAVYLKQVKRAKRYARRKKKS